MGALESDTGAYCVLWADYLIGRAPDCGLRLEHHSVSWRHASLRWNGNAWELQDLASLNGTFVNDKPLDAKRRALLRTGDKVRFGHDERAWLVVDADPPEAVAVALDDGSRITPVGGLIALPDPEQPEVSIYRNADGAWMAEGPDGTWFPEREEVVNAGGRGFRFEPGGVVNATTGPRPTRMTPSSIALELAVTRNEEQVEITIVHNGTRVVLKPRAHGYLLLTLARARLADLDDASLGASSHGWVDHARLLKMLATTPAQLALDIYRARRQFDAAGVLDAAQVIERRAASRELRIGVEKLTIQVV
jgi:hypothetical protein